MSTEAIIAIITGVSAIVVTIWGSTLILWKSWGTLSEKIEGLRLTFTDFKERNLKSHDIVFQKIGETNTHLNAVDGRVVKLEAQQEIHHGKGGE